MTRSRKSRNGPDGNGGGNNNNNVEMEPEPQPQQQAQQQPQPNPPPALWAGIQLHQLGLPQGPQPGQILPANPFGQGQVAAIPANPQQANPAPLGFGAALAALGQGQLIPPGLVINNPNPNPQGRKRKSRKQKSRKQKSRKHKSNRR